jgi:uncharacterized protein
MNGKNPVVHFEYEDKDRLASFYEQAFGWKMNKTGPEMGEYVVAQTTETDEQNMVKTPGTINGGFFPKSMATGGPAYPSVVIAVEDIKAGMEKVRAAGGTVQGEPVEIPGIGKYVSFADTEGNRVSLLQPNPRA